ncbi:4-hydroxy-2-oxoheptanedioate aldolase [Rhodococcus sp. 27YEA15]|uniref:HpcH/HpaI aldolase family protein n=1 Tax=Rhodococcus sp. 27YEA15 TaxID=3156259 RepID=UPI003C7B36B0
MTEGSLGIWSTLRDPQAAIALAQEPFGWIAIDQQHGFARPGDTLDILTALRNWNGRKYVRVAENSFAEIGRALDNGADGVIVPMINSPHEARAAVEATRFPPVGRRSWGPYRGGAAANATPEEINATIECLVMIETAEGLGSVKEIAAVPGVTGVFVGLFDLACALGITVHDLLNAQDAGAPLSHIVSAARDAGITAAAFGGSGDTSRILTEAGFHLTAVITDVDAIVLGAVLATTAASPQPKDGRSDT